MKELLIPYPDGLYYARLLKVIPFDHLELYLNIYVQIASTDINKVDFPKAEMGGVGKYLASLQKQQWISEKDAMRVINILVKAMIHGRGKKNLEVVNMKMIALLGGGPANSQSKAEDFLIYVLVHDLKNKKSRGVFRDVYGFLIEQKIFDKINFSQYQVEKRYQRCSLNQIWCTLVAFSHINEMVMILSAAARKIKVPFFCAPEQPLYRENFGHIQYEEACWRKGQIPDISQKKKK